MVGLASFAALVLAVGLWVWVLDDEYVAPSGPSQAGAAARPAEAALALQQLTEAVRTGDAAAAAALAPPGDPRAARLLREVVKNARKIPVDEVALRYLDELGGIEAGEWRAAVEMTWRLGEDREPAVSEVEVGFAAVDDQVAITTIGGAHGRTPVWVDPRVEVKRSPQVLVVAARSAGWYHALARRAVGAVRRVVPDWSSPLVVEVPGTARGVDRALAAEPGSYRNVAGVTASPDGSTAATPRVFLNPQRMAELSARGAQVVVSHEAAHVALGAASSASLPLWLVEGFADYVALRDIGLPLSVTASQVAAQVRRDGLPRSLPDEDDFDEQSEHFGAAYEASWLACRLLVERSGERAVLRFYREAQATSDFGPAFRSTFGLGLRAFTREWRRALSDLAT